VGTAGISPMVRDAHEKASQSFSELEYKEQTEDGTGRMVLR